MLPSRVSKVTGTVRERVDDAGPSARTIWILANWAELQPRRIGVIRGARERVSVRLSGDGCDRIPRQELTRDRVVVAGSEVLEPGLSVCVLPGVAKAR